MEISIESTSKLLEALCQKVDVPVEKPSPSLFAKLFTAVTAIEVPSDAPPLDQLRNILSILADEVVRVPLDHIKAENILSCETEAVFDLLEILTTCVHLRDDSVTTTSPEMTTAGSCLTSLHSAMTSLESSNGSSSSGSDSLFSSETSCSTCESASESSALSGSTLFSEATLDIDLPCRLCQYISNRSFLEISDSKTISDESEQQENTSPCPLPPTGKDGVTDIEAERTSNLRSESKSANGMRPSKAHRVNLNPATIAGKFLATRKDLHISAANAYRKFQREKASTTSRPAARKAPAVHKKDFIKPVVKTLKPDEMPAPENGLDTHPKQSHAEDEVNGAEEFSLSPHLARVLRKQYDQHLQWMTSCGVSESGLKKLERDYDDLIERHTDRIKQMRAEAANQNRIALLKAQKGITHTVRNLKTHAKSQATQLAHVQLEAERLQRSKEAKMRIAEEKLLRETFVEALRIQKEQLLDLKKNLAEQRMREGDKHKIYMQGLEHFYKTQLDMLAETLNKEHRDGELRNGAQMALLRGMRKELKDKLDKEVAFLKDLVALDPDP